MSVTVKFTISDERYDELSSRANNSDLSVQDYIRKELFNDYGVITPRNAINRAIATYSKGETFTVPGLFGDEWDLPNGAAGQFGKRFLSLVETEYSDQISFTKNFNSKKHAIYEVL